jgi:uncharacterized protein YqjF (DUF2071 family)
MEERPSGPPESGRQMRRRSSAEHPSGVGSTGRRRDGGWLMAQKWHHVLFAHWPVSQEALRVVTPAALEIDTFEGRAWVGITAFWLSGARPRGLPPLPGISAFPEINVRTYVRLGKKPGVWFLSLDAGGWIAVAVARRLYHLPYFHARMKMRVRGNEIEYESFRRDRMAPPAEFRARYHPVGPVFHAQAGTLEHFLTERYCLYAAGDRQLFRADIAHRPWPLQQAEAKIGVNTMAAAHELALPDAQPHLLYAKRVDVRVWPLLACGRDA